jgi:LacI family transcriptional regulator
VANNEQCTQGPTVPKLKKPKNAEQGKLTATADLVRRPPTIRDVAKRAGISIGTVSRVLNENDTVATEIRERVLESMRAIGYVPNRVAQSMRKRATLTVGCLVTDVRLTTVAEMISAAERRLRTAGYDMFVANSHNDPQQEETILRFFQQRQLDAIITVVTDDQDPGRLRILKSLNMPIVLWERDGGDSFDTVLTDHYGGCLQACSYLLGLGHRRIALIGGQSKTWAGREMARGYSSAITQANGKVDSSLIFQSGSFGISACSEILRSKDRVTAVIGIIDDVALVCKVARGMGLKVPEDLSVISIGDSDFLSMNSPTITAIRYDLDRVGETAAEFVLERLGNKSVAGVRRVIYPVEMIVRESCAHLTAVNWKVPQTPL